MKYKYQAILFLIATVSLLTWFLVSDPRRARAEKFLKYHFDRHGIVYSKIICPDARVAFGVTDSSTISIPCKVTVGRDQLSKLTDMLPSIDQSQTLSLKINLEAYADARVPGILGYGQKATWLPLESALEIEVETNK